MDHERRHDRSVPMARGRHRRGTTRLGACPERPNGRGVHPHRELHRPRIPHPRDPRHRRPHPLCASAGRVPLQLLAGRRARTRPVASHDDGAVPARRTRMGRPRRPRRRRRGRGRELGVVGCPGAAARSDPRAHQLVARWCRRECDPRVRSRRATIRLGPGQFRTTRGEDGHRVDRLRHRLCGKRFRRRVAHRLGLSATREALAARHSDR